MNIRTLLAIMTIGVVSTAFSSGVVKNVTARQIQPWRGLVEIQYELTEDVIAPTGKALSTTIICEDLQNGTNYLAFSINANPTYERGVHKLVWNAGRDKVVIRSRDVVFRVSISTAQYCVIDLAEGVDATYYPVRYLDSVPAGGWTEEYKTTRLVLKYIEPGKFTMGSKTTEDNVPHEVTLTEPFFMGVFEVTQKQYELVTGDVLVPSNEECRGGCHPVEVSWNLIRGNSDVHDWPKVKTVDDKSFVGKLRLRTGIDFDLPTEAKWEYACRAGTSTTFSFTYFSSEYMWFRGRSGSHEVGLLRPNPWGLYDVHGNAYEWCLDWYYWLEETKSVVNPLGPEDGSNRVRRGGAWYADTEFCESAARDCSSPTLSYGFRLCGPVSQ